MPDLAEAMPYNRLGGRCGALSRFRLGLWRLTVYAVWYGIAAALALALLLGVKLAVPIIPVIGVSI
jgi:hypothetical protein